MLLDIVISNPAQGIWIVLPGGVGCQRNDLIADHSIGRIGGLRIAALELDILFGARYVKCGSRVEPVESLEVDVAPIHHVEGHGFQNQLIEDLHVRELAIANEYASWNVSVEVQQSVHFHGTLALAEPRPGEQGKAEVDRGGVQSVGAQSQVLAERITRVETPRASDDHAG